MGANAIGVDICPCPPHVVEGDMHDLPFESDTFDFVFSSSALHWELDIKSSFEEVYRILKPGGLFLFSTYGLGGVVFRYFSS